MEALLPSPVLLEEVCSRTVVAATTSFPASACASGAAAGVRAALALRTLEKCAALALPVVLVDEASDPAWLARAEAALGLGPAARDAGPAAAPVVLSEIVQFGAVEAAAPGRHNFGRAKRLAIRVAAAAARTAGRDLIVLLEPEKHTFVLEDGGAVVPFSAAAPRRALLATSPLLASAARVAVLPRGRAAVGIPARTDGMRSYPAQQAEFELRGNREAARILGDALAASGRPRCPELDLWFGPRVITLAAAPRFFAGFEAEEERAAAAGAGDGGSSVYGVDMWETLMVPVWHMMLEGLDVVACSCRYTHPAEQTALEEDGAHAPEFERKRAFQFETLMCAARRLVEVVCADGRAHAPAR